jgi:hypothetical protein
MFSKACWIPWSVAVKGGRYPRADIQHRKADRRSDLEEPAVIDRDVLPPLPLPRPPWASLAAEIDCVFLRVAERSHHRGRRPHFGSHFDVDRQRKLSLSCSSPSAAGLRLEMQNLSRGGRVTADAIAFPQSAKSVMSRLQLSSQKLRTAKLNMAEMRNQACLRPLVPVPTIATVEARQLEMVSTGTAGHYNLAGGPHLAFSSLSRRSHNHNLDIQDRGVDSAEYHKFFCAEYDVFEA